MGKILNPTQNFGNVPDALSPLSANVETIICVYDCSGNTITVDTPHPTFSNGRGKDVVQMNLVQLGGQNGLYS